MATGFFFEVKVNIDRKISESSVSIVFNVSEGERTFFGKNIFIGNDKTKLEVIERQLTHKTGAPFDYSELIREKRTSLSSRAFYRYYSRSV